MPRPTLAVPGDRPRWSAGAIAGAGSIAALLGYALWVRVVDLPTIPGVGGDECWYGVQMGRFLAGKPYETRTPTGLPLNPFFAWWEVPLLAVAGPRGWVLRVPAVGSGLLAIGAAYGLLIRPLGRTAAAVAALTLAVLPVAVLFSRLGWDQCQAPLIGVLVVAFALRGEPVRLALAAYAFLWVHPVNAIALPAALLPFLIVAWSRWPRRRWVAIVAAVAGSGLLAQLAVGSNTQPVLVAPRDSLFSTDRWMLYADRFDRFVSGDAAYAFYAGPADTYVRNLAARSVMWAGLVLGGASLVGRRRWDQVGLVAGLVIAIVGFGVVAGPNGIKPELIRYPMSLVGPLAVAFACLVDAILPAVPEGGRPPRARVAALVALGLLAWLPLIDFDRSFLRPIRRDGGHGPRFRAGPVDPKRAVLDLALDDLAGVPVDRATLLRRTVLAEDYWIFMPLLYFAQGHPEVVFGMCSNDPGSRRQEIERALTRGGAFVGFAGGGVERELQAVFPADRLRRREVPAYGGGPVLVLYRLREASVAVTERP